MSIYIYLFIHDGHQIAIMLSIGPLGWSYLHAFYLHMHNSMPVINWYSLFIPLCLYLSFCQRQKFSPCCVALFFPFFFVTLCIICSSCIFLSLFYCSLLVHPYFISSSASSFFLFGRCHNRDSHFLSLSISLILSHNIQCHDCICNLYAFICI